MNKLKKTLYILLLLSLNSQLFCRNIELYINDKTIVKGIDILFITNIKQDTIFILDNNTIFTSEENLIIKYIKRDDTKLVKTNKISLKNFNKILIKKANKSFVTSKSHYLDRTSALKILISSSNTSRSFILIDRFKPNHKQTTHDILTKFIGNYIHKNIKSIFFVNFYNKPPPPFF